MHTAAANRPRGLGRCIRVRYRQLSAWPVSRL